MRLILALSHLFDTFVGELSEKWLKKSIETLLGKFL